MLAFARDKFWMFGVRPHQDDIWLKPADNRSVPYRQRSRITPAEGAMLLDAQNMLMVNCDGEPAPFSEEALGYAESFARMKRVLWGGTGSGGFRIGNEEAFICKLAEKYPNIAGEFLDSARLGVELHKLALVEGVEAADVGTHPVGRQGGRRNKERKRRTVPRAAVGKACAVKGQGTLPHDLGGGTLF